MMIIIDDIKIVSSTKIKRYVFSRRATNVVY